MRAYFVTMYPLSECFRRCGWINYAGRPVRPTRYQPGATPWESVMCDCRPERAKALPKHHSFALSGRIYTFPTTQGVAQGYELVALSGSFNRTGRLFFHKKNMNLSLKLLVPCLPTGRLKTLMTLTISHAIPTI